MNTCINANVGVEWNEYLYGVEIRAILAFGGGPKIPCMKITFFLLHITSYYETLQGITWHYVFPRRR